MYQQYWGLRESPFSGGLEVSRFFATANHDEALARLHFLVEGRRHLGLVAGKFGLANRCCSKSSPSGSTTMGAKSLG